MKFHDGQGREGAEIELAATRPDLPHCATCDDGKKCNCAVYWKPGVPDMACACMGFLGCPDCPRKRSGFIVMDFDP